MIKNQAQFIAANQAALGSFIAIANGSLSSAERLAALNLNTTRAFLDEMVGSYAALCAAKDPQALIALQTSLVKPAVERSMTYSRSIYEIINESATGIGRIAEDQAAELKKNFSDSLELSLQSAPGSEAVVTAVKSAIAAADSAYGNMAKAAKQAAETLGANVATANAATLKLISKAA